MKNQTTSRTADNASAGLTKSFHFFLRRRSSSGRSARNSGLFMPLNLWPKKVAVNGANGSHSIPRPNPDAAAA